MIKRTFKVLLLSFFLSFCALIAFLLYSLQHYKSNSRIFCPEDKLQSYLEHIEQSCLPEALQLMRSIDSEARARESLPEWDALCLRAAEAWNDCHEGEGLLLELREEKSHYIRLARMEDATCQRSKELIMAMQLEYERLAKHNFYANPHLENYLLSYFITPSQEKNYGISLERWFPLYSQRKKAIDTLAGRATEQIPNIPLSDMMEIFPSMKEHRSLPFYRSAWNKILPLDYLWAGELSDQGREHVDLYLFERMTQAGLTPSYAPYRPAFPMLHSSYSQEGLSSRVATMNVTQELCAVADYAPLAKKLKFTQPLEAARVVDIFCMSYYDMRHHPRSVPFIRNEYPHIMGDFVLRLMLQAPCKYTSLFLRYDEGGKCHAYYFEKAQEEKELPEP